MNHSSNGPTNVTNARCYCDSLINKPLYRRQAAKISRRKFPWSPRRRRPPWISCHRRVLPGAAAPSLSPPHSLCTIVPDHGRAPLRVSIFPNLSRWCHRPRRHRPQARDAVPEPATTSSSPSSWRCAPDAIPEPVASSPRCPSVCDNIKPTLSLTPQRRCPPQARKATLYIFLSFWAYKSWFGYATLPHYFDMLYCFCSTALL
jgi:hypothetical protein